VFQGKESFDDGNALKHFLRGSVYFVLLLKRNTTIRSVEEMCAMFEIIITKHVRRNWSFIICGSQSKSISGHLQLGLLKTIKASIISLCGGNLTLRAGVG